jgi:hypothetical protein
VSPCTSSSESSGQEHYFPLLTTLCAPLFPKVGTPSVCSVLSSSDFPGSTRLNGVVTAGRYTSGSGHSVSPGVRYGRLRSATLLSSVLIVLIVERVVARDYIREKRRADISMSVVWTPVGRTA